MKGYFLFPVEYIGSVDYASSCVMLTEAASRGLNRPEVASSHSHPSSAEV